MEEMQPQGAGVDVDTETFETMVAGLIEHIFGPAEKDMKSMLLNSKDVGQDIGAATLALVQSAAEQAGQAKRDFDLDMLLGVATEVIDSLMGMAESLGVIESADDDDVRSDALLTAVNGYIATLEPGSEEREAAKQVLQQMMDEGMVGEAESTIAEMGKRRGVDPFAEDEGLDQQPSPQQPAEQPAAGRRLMAG